MAETGGGPKPVTSFPIPKLPAMLEFAVLLLYIRGRLAEEVGVPIAQDLFRGAG
jgi:hypothetical protein